MDVNNYPTVDAAGLKELVRLAIDTKIPLLVLGPPGTGKTLIAQDVARKAYAEKFPELYGSGKLSPVAYYPPALAPPEESGGIPTREADRIVRKLVGPVAEACTRPALLLLDEITRCDARQQGGLMVGVNERRWGDFLLHPDTSIVLLGNEPDSGGVFSLLDALLNRCLTVRYQPRNEEFLAWAPDNLGAEGSLLRELVRDYCATAAVRTELVQSIPPPGFAESGALWASWRAIEKGLTALAGLLTRNPNAPEDLLFATLAGCIGKVPAAGYLTARRLREALPRAEDIVADPKSARLPTDFEAAVSALGLLDRVARNSPEAAWIYAGRFTSEPGLGDVAGALARQLRTHPPVNRAHPLHAEAFRVFMAVQGKAAVNAARSAI
jgi:DNA polymerase III delta prime subunit